MRRVAHFVFGARLKTLLTVIALATSLAPACAAADALDRLRAFVSATRTVEAEFSQTVADRNGRVTQRASGTLAFSRPGKFRWDYLTPYRQTLVGDGERLWMHDPDLEQVTVKRLGDALDATPAALLAGDNTLEKHFVLKAAPAAGGLEWLTATPRHKDASFERVRMGFRGDTLDTLQLVDHFGQTTTLKIAGLKRNPALAPERFRFTPPPGADLIGD